MSGCLTNSHVPIALAFDSTKITLSTTLYQVAPGGALDFTNAGKVGDLGYQTFPPEFHEYILSDSALLASYPFLKTCITGWAHGIPSVKIRVSALTTTSYNTVVGSGILTTSSPDATHASSTSAVPGSTPKTPAVLSTTTAQKQASPSSNAPVGIPSTSPEPHTTSVGSSSSGIHENPSNRVPNGPPQSPSVSALLTQASIAVPASGKGEALPPTDTGTSTSAANAESKNDAGSSPVVQGVLPTTVVGPSYPSASSVIKPVAGSSTIAMHPHDTAPSAPTTPVIVVQGQTLTADAASNYAVGPQMLVPGGSAITVDSIYYSLAPSATALVSASSTITLFSPADGLPKVGPPIITLDNQEYTATSASQYVVGTQTLAPGGQAVTVNNIPYSLAPLATALVSGGSIIPLPPKYNGVSDRTTVGSVPTADSVSGLVIDTQTLLPGGPAHTINGVLYSLAPSANALVSGSYTIPLTPSLSPNRPLITVGENTYTANSASYYIIGTQTLIAGAPAITVNGAPYSLAPLATALVSGSITIPLATASSDALPPITIAGTTYTANSASQYMIGTQTLIANSGPITINSTPYALSVGPSAEALYVGTSTSFLPSALPNTGSATPTISLLPNPTDPSHGYIVDGQTLTPGSEITVGGTKISLGAQGTDVVVGGTTEVVGLGGVIMSGFGAGPTASVGNASNGVVRFTGGTSGKLLPRGWGVYGIIMISLLMWFGR